MIVEFSQTLSGLEAVPDAHAALLWPEAVPTALSASTGEPGRAVVIGLHGYRATPEEIAPVLQRCQAAGLDAVSMLFAGHGVSDPALQRTAIRQMYPRAMHHAVAREVRRCRARGYQRVYLYGHSMGGAVAVKAAALEPVDGVALTAPAVELPLGARLVRLLPPSLNLHWARASSAGEAPRRYTFETAWNLRKLLRIAEDARGALPELQCPILVLLAGRDETVPGRVGDLIAAAAGGEVQQRVFEECGHSMTHGEDAAEVSAAVADFLAAIP